MISFDEAPNLVILVIGSGPGPRPIPDPGSEFGLFGGTSDFLGHRVPDPVRGS